MMSSVVHNLVFQVMTGGPLIDAGGNFVGMNFCSMDRTPLLPSNKIVDFLVLKYVSYTSIEPV